MPDVFQRAKTGDNRREPPGGRARNRAFGQHLNLYIIERLYERIKLNHTSRRPQKRLKKSILIVAAISGSAPKSPVFRRMEHLVLIPAYHATPNFPTKLRNTHQYLITFDYMAVHAVSSPNSQL